MTCASIVDLEEAHTHPVTDATDRMKTEDTDAIATDGSELTHRFAAKAAGLHRANYVDNFLLTYQKKCVILNKHQISRSGAVVARRAHNPKVVGSSPSSATI